MPSLPDDAALARALAQDTGRVLLALRSEASRDGRPSSGRLGDLADAAAHRVLAEGLAKARPDDVVFSEEAPDPRRRLAASRVWIVDPLDGTREYAEPGRTDWAVHVAVWADGALVAGAVALPALGEVYGTDEISAACVDRAGPSPAPRIVVSRTRPPSIAAALTEELGGDLMFLGSAGVKAAAVWRGEADAYLHSGGLREWDAAAPVAVALAAGLHASRLDGTPLEFNRPDPLVPDLLICTPELAAPILARTGGAAGSGRTGSGRAGSEQHSTEVISR
jgi:3'(2'), 5'-bisphosphate nucleotidase